MSDHNRDKLIDKKNVYLAYRRVKNKNQNAELILDQEIKYFEKNLDENISDISMILGKANDEFQFQPFDFITKLKSICKGNVKYRPLVRFKFKDEIIMQSVFNIVCEELHNFLPKENYGIQLAGIHDEYLYEKWVSQYKKFTKQQKRNLSENTMFQYTYEYDISQFYPSIQQEKLLKDLIETLRYDKKDIICYWLEKIIYYYHPKNITDETKPIYEKFISNKEDFDTEDLGIPQGAIFSAFLASFNTRDLFDNIQKDIRKKIGVECEYFAYVDDGRLYFKDYVERVDIENIVLKNLEKLNSTTYNDKCIGLNTEKCCFVRIDEKSVTHKLEYLTSDISLINSSIITDYEIDDDEYNAVIQIHENYIHTIEKMYEDLSQKKKSIAQQNDIRKIEKEKKIIALQNDIRKIEKEFSTYAKRKASFLTRKISKKEKFFLLVDQVFSDYNDDSNDDSSDDSNDKLESNLCDMNFYYNLMNMMENAGTDASKIKYLCDRIDSMLESYAAIESIGDVMMLYYYISVIKVYYLTEYSKHKEDYIKKLQDKFMDNFLFYKYRISFNQPLWYINLIDVFQTKENNEKNKEHDSIQHYKDTENDSIQYYMKHMYELECANDPFSYSIDVSYHVGEETNLSLVKQYSNPQLVFSTDNYAIYILNSEEGMFTLKETPDCYKKLYDIENCKIKYIMALVSYWKREYKYKGYILPAYLDIQNIYCNNTDKDPSKTLSIYILNNTAPLFFELGREKYSIKYQEYFRNFFMNLFLCSDSIIVNKCGRSLRFWEYRILSYLHNHNFDIDDFLEIVTESLEKNDFYNHEIDNNYERIRVIVDKKLSYASDKDIIVQLHYFLQNVWKNGSKDLPFFTLHNQEHSLELIQNYMKLSKKMMSKLSLTKDENFILFGACYLHDIGMLKGLTKEELYDVENPKILRFYNEIVNMGSPKVVSKVENILNRIYDISNATASLSENIVRGQHHYRSFKDIQTNFELPLKELERAYIAEVSYNHNLDSIDIYGKQNKKMFRGKYIDIRKISFWLRLLDLTDISKYRVTQEVFNRYFDRMNDISRFHWVKHLSVNGITFEVTQSTSKNDTGITKIRVYVNMNYLPPEEKLRKECQNSNAECKGYQNKGKDGEIEYKRENKKSNKYCNLRCAFLNENKYFDNEVENLNLYAKTYDENFEMELIYKLDAETKRDDFPVISKAFSNVEASATDCIKKYFS